MPCSATSPSSPARRPGVSGNAYRKTEQAAAAGQAVVDAAADEGHVGVAAADHHHRRAIRRLRDEAAHQRGKADGACPFAQGSGALQETDHGLGDGVVVHGDDGIDDAARRPPGEFAGPSP